MLLPNSPFRGLEGKVAMNFFNFLKKKLLKNSLKNLILTNKSSKLAL